MDRAALHTQIEHSLEHFREELAKIHTGRPTPGLVDELTVDYQGATLPIKQVATVTVPDATSIVIAPWDRSNLRAVEEAVRDSGLGFNPTNNGEVVRVSVPPLSEERRREYVKLVENKLEATKVSLRNIRRDLLAKAKREWDEQKVSEDVRRREESEADERIRAAGSEAEGFAETKKAELLSQ